MEMVFDRTFEPHLVVKYLAFDVLLSTARDIFLGIRPNTTFETEGIMKLVTWPMVKNFRTFFEFPLERTFVMKIDLLYYWYW